MYTLFFLFFFSIYTILQHTHKKNYKFNVQKFSKKVWNSALSMKVISQRMCIILYIQSIQFFEECTLFRTFKVHNFSKNVHKSLYSTYTSCRRMYTILLFNVHNILTNVPKKKKDLTYTVFQKMFKILSTKRTQFLKKFI